MSAILLFLTGLVLAATQGPDGAPGWANVAGCVLLAAGARLFSREEASRADHLHR